MQADDRAMMQRALRLAAGGLGRVEPNPVVGCVVVRDGRIIGEGFHARFGGPHAEVVALHAAGKAARGATLYVTLEPCCHHGKTPPCTDAILAAGVARVVAATEDPFPRVAGGGTRRLREAGVTAEVGLLGEEARHLNAAYLKRQATGRPLVVAKWAMTLDGRIATAAGDSRWITGAAARRRVHEVRRIADAVLVGAGTARADRPSLTVRHVAPLPERGQPARVILDDGLVLDPGAEPAASARDVPVLVYTRPGEAEHARAAALRKAGCEVLGVEADTAGVSPGAVLDDLGARGMSRVMVEGGARVFGSFFTAGCVDRVLVFMAPKILGAAGALGPVAGPDGRALAEAWPVLDVQVDAIGEDWVLEGRVGPY